MSTRYLGPYYPSYLGSGRNRKPLIREQRWCGISEPARAWQSSRGSRMEARA